MSWLPAGLNVSGKTDVVERPSIEDFDAILREARPVVIKGELASSKALHYWSVDYLRERCGNTQVRVFVSHKGDHSVDIFSTSSTRKEVADMTLGEFLGRISNSGAYPKILGEGELYYLYASPAQAYEAVAADLPEPRYLANSRWGAVRSNLWISQPGNVTQAHSDPFHDNLLAQIHGVKRLILWEPSQASLLYLNSYVDGNGGLSSADFLHPENFPKLAQSRGYEVVLHPGDILFIPEAWIHYVNVESLSISVNYWFSLNLEFQNAVGEMNRCFQHLRPELKRFYAHLLGLSDKVIQSLN